MKGPSNTNVAQNELEAEFFEMNGWENVSDDVSGSGNLNYQEVEIKIKKELMEQTLNETSESETDDTTPRIRSAEEASYVAKSEGYESSDIYNSAPAAQQQVAEERAPQAQTASQAATPYASNTNVDNGGDFYTQAPNVEAGGAPSSSAVTPSGTGNTTTNITNNAGDYTVNNYDNDTTIINNYNVYNGGQGGGQPIVNIDLDIINESPDVIVNVITGDTTTINNSLVDINLGDVTNLITINNGNGGQGGNGGSTLIDVGGINLGGITNIITIGNNGQSGGNGGGSLIEIGDVNLGDVNLDVVNTVTNIVQTVAPGVIETVGGVTQTIVPPVVQIVTGTVDGITQTIIPPVLETVSGIIEPVLPPVIEIVTGTVGGLTETVFTLPEVVGGIAGNTLDLTQNAVNGIPVIVGGVTETVGDIAATILPPVVAVVTETVSGVTEAVFTLPELVGGTVEAVLDTAQPAIGGVVENVTGITESILPPVIDTVTDAALTLPELVGGTVEAVLDAPQAVIADVAAPVVGIVETVLDTALNLPDGGNLLLVEVELDQGLAGNVEVLDGNAADIDLGLDSGGLNVHGDALQTDILDVELAFDNGVQVDAGVIGSDLVTIGLEDGGIDLGLLGHDLPSIDLGGTLPGIASVIDHGVADAGGALLNNPVVSLPVLANILPSVPPASVDHGHHSPILGHLFG